jgi:hypothetical protein
MLKLAGVLVCLFSLVFAWEGEDPPELEGALRSGIYEITDIVVRDVPGTKQDGDAWDPFGGLPDIYLTVFTDDGSGPVAQGSTRVVENAGSTASFEGIPLFRIFGPEEFSGPEVQRLVFKIWDLDTFDPDYIDTGEISTSVVDAHAENTVVCNYGTEITFTITWLGME